MDECLMALDAGQLAPWSGTARAQGVRWVGAVAAVITALRSPQPELLS